MRKSNHVFSDPTNGGILNVNQLQSKPSGSSLNIESLLLSTLCCIKSNVKDKPYTLSPLTAATAAPFAPAAPASLSIGDFQQIKKEEFKFV